MKEENFDNNPRPDRDATKQTGKTPQPFNSANESRSDSNYVNPSKPPKRDVSGKRVDVDDTSFGIELW